MHAQLEELWIDAMEMKVGEQITTYLRKNHPEYQEIEARQKKLIEDYPMLWKVVDGDGTVTLNEKEHCALKEYLSNQDDMRCCSQPVPVGKVLIFPEILCPR